MAALGAPKRIVKVDGPDYLRKVPVAAAVIIYAGALISKLAGYAKPAAAGDDKVIGVANLSKWDDVNAQGTSSVIGATTWEVVDNSLGIAGARHIAVEMGVFKFLNKAGDLIDETMIGDPAYVENDQTVRATSAGSIVAGTVIGLDDDGGVFVQVPAGAYGRM